VPADLDTLCDDLLAEGADVVALVAPLDAGTWLSPTPAAGWSIRDQVTHLAHFDDLARLAITDPDRFRAELPVDLGVAVGLVDAAVEADRSVAGPDAVAWLRRSRLALTDAARSCDPRLRVPWYGPDMTVVSSITARVMETWAHGQDIADALGVERVPTDRLRHVAFICSRTLPNSFLARGLPVPEVPVRLELVGPGGDPWVFGPDEATDVVRGPALDFCLLATRRRHRDDTALVAAGPVADQWLSIAQAFAGPPGEDREPGAFGGPPGVSS
jgi:uncharacterized protein (TIGR03084 family)